MTKEHSIYIIQNNVNLKIYVGYSSNAGRRWADHKRTAKQSNHPEHNKPLYCDIREFGLDNFSFYVIKKFDTEKEALQAEIDCIEALKTNITKYGKECNGYNLHSGGSNPPVKRRTLSQKQEQQVCEMYISGKSCLEISEEINSTMPIVSTCLRANNIQMRKGAPHKSLSITEEKEVCDTYMNGKHSTEIALEYDISYNVIIKTLRENNIQIRSRQERRGNRSLFDQEKEIEICEQYKNDIYTANKLAEIYDCDLSTIYDCLQKYNIPKKRKILPNELTKEMYNKRMDGMTYVDIAKLYGCSPTNVAARIKKYLAINE